MTDAAAHAAAASPLGGTTPLWLSFVGKLAPLSSVMLYMAPIPTVQELNKKKTIGDLPLLPYTSMLSNSLVWLVYGLLNSELKLITANGIGLALSIWYFLSFARVTPPGASTLPGTLDQHIQGFVSIVAFILWQARSKKVGPIGKLGVMINMALYASPLAAIRAVLETKSSASIPLPLTVASFLSCIFWTITGYLDMQDPYVWIPTIFGIVFGMAQIMLKVIFNDKTSNGMEAVEDVHSLDLIDSQDAALELLDSQDLDLPRS